MKRHSLAVMILFGLGLTIGGLAGHVWAQTPVQSGQGKPASATMTAPQTPSKFSFSVESRKRQQAYLRYLEAQRLKNEVLRTRSMRLLEDAIKAFREASELDPEAAEPHVDLGEIYFFHFSRHEVAEREAEIAIKLDPKNVGAHLLLGRVYIHLAKMENNPRSLYLDRAMRAYEKVAEFDPGQAEAWAFLADLYQLRNNQSREIFALEKWTGAPIPNDPLFYQRMMNADLMPDRAYYRLSLLYLSQGKNRQAIDAARRAYEANPDAGEYASNLISVLREAGTSADELRIYGQLMKTANSPALWLGYGSALIRAGRAGEAVERLQEYIKLDPANASAIGLLALAQRRADQRSAAIETLKAGLARVEPGIRTNLLLELGQIYEELGRNDDAILQYEQAFDSFTAKGGVTPVNAPLFNEIVTRLVQVCRRSGQQTKLQAVLTRARRLVDEHNPLLDHLTIDMLREDGKRREALDLALAAIRRYPDDRSLKFTEALILADLRRFNDAAERLRALLKGNPEDATDDATVYLLLGGVQLQAGQLVEAEASIRKAMTLNPDDPEALVQLSSVQDRAGKHTEAEKTLRDLLRRHSDYATALNNLGYQLLERGERFDEALKLIEQAVAIEPINGSFLDSLGWANFKLGRLEKARENLERAMMYSRRNATLHEHLGDVLKELGKLAEARRQWERALEYSIEADEMARLKVKLKDLR